MTVVRAAMAGCCIWLTYTSTSGVVTTGRDPQIGQQLKLDAVPYYGRVCQGRTGGGRMLADVVRTMYEYNAWAYGRVLDHLAALTTVQLNAPGTAGHGSIRETFVHALNAQRGWLSWWDGSNPAFASTSTTASGRGLKVHDFPDAVSLLREWKAIDVRTQAFTSKLDDPALTREYKRRRAGQPDQVLALWQMMLHVVNHGTQHRSEIAAMLTGFDHSPGALDMTAFLRERGKP